MRYPNIYLFYLRCNGWIARGVDETGRRAALAVHLKETPGRRTSIVHPQILLVQMALACPFERAAEGGGRNGTPPRA